MKLISKISILAATTLGFAVASVHADTFHYSYTFNDGLAVKGAFDGTENGNLINKITNVTLFVDNVPVGGPIFAVGNVFADMAYEDGASIVSFDGTQNNFLFLNSDYGMGNWNFTGGFASGMDTVSGGDINVGEGLDVPMNSSWSVTDVSTHSVPDGGSSLAMLAGAFAGLAALRRRFAK